MSITEHNIKLRSDDEKHDGKPFFMACSCGTEGRFQLEEEALKYVHQHITAAKSPNITFQTLVIHNRKYNAAP